MNQAQGSAPGPNPGNRRKRTELGEVKEVEEREIRAGSVER